MGWSVILGGNRIIFAQGLDKIIINRVNYFTPSHGNYYGNNVEFDLNAVKCTCTSLLVQSVQYMYKMTI